MSDLNDLRTLFDRLGIRYQVHEELLPADDRHMAIALDIGDTILYCDAEGRYLGLMGEEYTEYTPRMTTGG